MNSVSYAFLDNAPVIPVIAIQKLEHAVPLAEALVAGGIMNLEVTLRTEHGLKAITLIRDRVKGANVGVGTVCNATEFDAAASNSVALHTVPTPTLAPFTRSLIKVIALSPCSVLSVTSRFIMPPATSASAKGTACSSFWIAITGITGALSKNA